MVEAPAVELQAPDLSRWRAGGGRGGGAVEGLHVVDSGVPGPRVLVQALTHGNEICGAIALDWLLRQVVDAGWRPLCGRLVVVFANLAAFDRFDPDQPYLSRCVDEDYNRIWDDAALGGPRDSVELRRARALRPWVDEADLLLDLHSMGEPGRPLMVCGQVAKNVALAQALGQPADLLLDTGHPSGLRMIERGGCGDPASPRKALLIECGQHWEAAAAEVAVDTLVRFLGLAGLAAASWVRAHARRPLPVRQRLVRASEAVVACSTSFRFLVPAVNLGVVERAGTPLAQDGDRVWHAPHDNTVLVMPGTRNLQPGSTAVRLGRFETL